MSWLPMRAILAYGLLSAVVLACLHLVSLAPMALGVGRELAGAAIAVVAMAVGLLLARRRPLVPPPTPPTAPTPASAPAAASAPPVPAPAPEPLLTQREQQVLRLLCTGHSNKLMARTLSLSENTVKTHVASVFAKLGVNRRAQVQDVAARLGLLDTRHSGA
jgi:DNA-binding NarL/FixJ family response regulator